MGKLIERLNGDDMPFFLLLQTTIKKKAPGILFAIFVLGAVFAPQDAHASGIGDFFKNLFGFGTESPAAESKPAEKPFPFLSSEPVPKAEAVPLEIIDDTSLVSNIGPLGNAAEAAESAQTYMISTYTVRKGDSLGLIARTFGVSVQTITWANDIPRGGAIKEGEVLIILPVSGIQHTVQKGDTIASIAKKYGGDPDDIVDFNDIALGESLEVGSVVIVPDGEASEPAPQTTKPRTQIVRGSGPELVGYYLRPIVGGRKTQGIHGYNGVDLAAPRGSVVRSAASGTVIIARASGWNGGYGKYVVVAHPNGTQTLYAHLNSVDARIGAAVAQGQMIGLVGSTGKSTGSHLHFEVRGAKNPF